jgi:hypothetical protein
MLCTGTVRSGPARKFVCLVSQQHYSKSTTELRDFDCQRRQLPPHPPTFQETTYQNTLLLRKSYACNPNTYSTRGPGHRFASTSSSSGGTRAQPQPRPPPCVARRRIYAQHTVTPTRHATLWSSWLGSIPVSEPAKMALCFRFSGFWLCFYVTCVLGWPQLAQYTPSPSRAKALVLVYAAERLSRGRRRSAPCSGRAGDGTLWARVRSLGYWREVMRRYALEVYEVF